MAYQGPLEQTKPHSEESHHHLSSQLFPKNKFSNESLSKKKKKKKKNKNPTSEEPGRLQHRVAKSWI